MKRLVPLMILIVAACDDPFAARRGWDATPDTLMLFSASRPEYIGLFSAVDIAFVPGLVQPVPIEAPTVTGNWDFALLDQAGGGLALVPAGNFPGLESRARIAVVPNRTLDEVREASRDTADYQATPALIQAGTVYVVRSRRVSCGISAGTRYAKLRPVEINEAAGTFTFEIVRNPRCDDRSFVPPED